MEFRQLEVFVAVAEQKSFSAAAQQLHLSQSTVSTHVSALEKELKTEPIHRSRRSFRLTEEGQRLYDYARSILFLQQKAVRDISAQGRTQLHIGTSSVPAQCILPKLLAGFRQEDPAVRYRVSCMDSGDVIAQVADGSLDLGFVGTKLGAACVYVPLMKDELVVVTPNTAEYQTIRQGTVSAADLMKLPLLLRDGHSGTMTELSRYLARHGIGMEVLNVQAYISDADTLRRCVMEELGASILSYRSVEEQIRQGSLLAFPLGDESLTRQLYLVYRDQAYLPGCGAKLISFAGRLYRQEVGVKSRGAGQWRGGKPNPDTEK